MESYNCMRQAERKADECCKAGDVAGAEAAFRQVMAASDAFEHEPATRSADIRLKLKEASAVLREDDRTAELGDLLGAHRVPRRVAAKWREALRPYLIAVEVVAPDLTYPANLMRSVLAGGK